MDKLRSKFPRINFGIEWGGGASIYEKHRFIYTDETFGTLMPPDTHDGIVFETDAYILANIGIQTGSRSNIGLRGGYMGLYGKRRSVPVLISYTFFTNGSSADGMFFRTDAGMAFPNRGSSGIAYMIAAGSGYRFALSRMIGLDFITNLRGCFDHPDIWNDELNKKVPPEHIRRNNAVYVMIDFGIALNF